MHFEKARACCSGCTFNESCLLMNEKSILFFMKQSSLFFGKYSALISSSVFEVQGCV